MLEAGSAARQEEGFRPCHLTAQDGLRLFYRDYGQAAADGLPVLCLPGLARNGRDFHPLASRLGKERRVVVLDYAGRGRSDRAPDWRRYGGPADLNDIRHLLAAAGLHRVVVIGTSYGGLLAMGLAAVAPRALVAVVLNDVAPEVAPSAQQRILRMLGEGRAQPDWAAAVAYLKTALPHLPFRTDAEWLDFARSTYVEDGHGGLRVAWDTRIVRPFERGATDRPDLWALFGALAKVPVLALRGALTDVVTEATAARMQAEHPHLTLATVPGVGHAPMLAEPESVAAIDGFLAQVA